MGSAFFVPFHRIRFFAELVPTKPVRQDNSMRMLQDHSHPKRILIYGVTGSGKTTLAKAVSEATGIPWHSVDDLTWEANWVQVPDEVQRERIQSICDQDRWILDTAYGKWRDIPIPRAELIVGLDYPRWVSLSRLVRRTLRRAIDQSPVCNGNRESWRMMFSRESIIAWHFRSFHRKRARIREWEAEFGPSRVLRFQHPRQVEEWLAELARTSHPGGNNRLC